MPVTGGIALQHAREEARSNSCWSPGANSPECQGQPQKQKIEPVCIRILPTNQTTHRADRNFASFMVFATIFLLTRSCCAPALPWGYRRHQWDLMAPREETTSSTSCPLQLLRPCVSAFQREQEAEARKIAMAAFKAVNEDRSRKRPGAQNCLQQGRLPTCWPS